MCSFFCICIFAVWIIRFALRFWCKKWAELVVLSTLIYNKLYVVWSPPTQFWNSGTWIRLYVFCFYWFLQTLVIFASFVEEIPRKKFQSQWGFSNSFYPVWEVLLLVASAFETLVTWMLMEISGWWGIFIVWRDVKNLPLRLTKRKLRFWLIGVDSHKKLLEKLNAMNRNPIGAKLT